MIQYRLTSANIKNRAVNNNVYFITTLAQVGEQFHVLNTPIFVKYEEQPTSEMTNLWACDNVNGHNNVLEFCFVRQFQKRDQGNIDRADFFELNIIEPRNDIKLYNTEHNIPFQSIGFITISLYLPISDSNLGRDNSLKLI